MVDAPETEGEISIRSLTPADWQDFRAIRLEALQSHPGMFGSTYAKESGYGAAEWQDWLGAEGKRMFGLYAAGQIVGVTGVVTSRDDGNGATGMLVASYIKPGFRGRNLSDPLYKARIDWAVDYLPWAKLIVSHRASNEPSRRANQRHGFVFTHKVSKKWPDGVTEDEWCYALDLNDLRRQRQAKAQASPNLESMNND